MGITVPNKYGGAGMDFTSYILAINEISKISAVVGVILSVHISRNEPDSLLWNGRAKE